MDTPIENLDLAKARTHSMSLAQAIRKFGGQPRESSSFRGVFHGLPRLARTDLWRAWLLPQPQLRSDYRASTWRRQRLSLILSAPCMYLLSILSLSLKPVKQPIFATQPIFLRLRRRAIHLLPNLKITKRRRGGVDRSASSASTTVARRA